MNPRVYMWKEHVVPCIISRSRTRQSCPYVNSGISCGVVTNEVTFLLGLWPAPAFSGTAASVLTSVPRLAGARQQVKSKTDLTDSHETAEMLQSETQWFSVYKSGI